MGASLENMEGAAFARACLALGVRGAELRALSNPAGVRDKAHWRTKEALSALARAVRRLLAEEGGPVGPPAEGYGDQAFLKNSSATSQLRTFQMAWR